MKKFFSKIWRVICQEMRKRKQIAALICPKCGGQLVYRDCPGCGIWLGCTNCNNEY